SRYDAPTRENVVDFLAFDPLNPSSILSCVQRARENARSVRDALSSDTWQQINRFSLFVSRSTSIGPAGRELRDFLAEVKLLSHLVSGTADNTMSHGEAWDFLQVGRLLERADNTSRLLDVKYFLLLPSPDDVGSHVDEMQWSFVLRSASALEMYRKRHGRLSPTSIIDFLLLDPEFPRAALFCLIHAEHSLRALSGGLSGRFQNAAEQRLGRLRSELAYAQVHEIIAGGLHEFLDSFQAKLNDIGDAIDRTFFALQPVSASENGATWKAASDFLPRHQGQ
ncbi:MAG: alpha-E domain-containing protein, partial [Armatimonadota bacterium]